MDSSLPPGCYGAGGHISEFCVCVCVSRAAPTGRMYVKFHARDIYENMNKVPNLVKIGQK